MAQDISKCKECGGVGRRVVKRKGLCGHCLRAYNLKNLTPCDLVKEQLTRGFVDCSPEGDYSILKKVLVQGKAESGAPVRGCIVQAHLVSRLWSEDTKEWDNIFETTRDVVDGDYAGGTDQQIQIHLGRCFADSIQDDLQKEALDPMHVAIGRCEIWDTLILGMQGGEVSQFVVNPQHAYGDAGHPPKVGPGEYINFEFEVLEIGEKLPEMPSREEFEQSKIEREKEERERAKANPEGTPEERIKRSEKARQEGNELFQKGDYAAAKKAYDGAFIHIYYSDEEIKYALPDGIRENVLDLKLKLHLNRAMCKIKLSQVDEALWDCDKALEIDPDNEKGLFRRSSVYSSRLENELAKDSRGEFWVLEKARDHLKQAKADFCAVVEIRRANGAPMGVDIKNARARLSDLECKLKECARRYRQDEKNLFQNKIWGAAKAQNEVERAHESQEAELAAQKALADDLKDMPDLE